MELMCPYQDLLARELESLLRKLSTFGLFSTASEPARLPANARAIDTSTKGNGNVVSASSLCPAAHLDTESSSWCRRKLSSNLCPLLWFYTWVRV
jgi:hypothetical protein